MNEDQLSVLSHLHINRDVELQYRKVTEEFSRFIMSFILGPVLKSSDAKCNPCVSVVTAAGLNFVQKCVKMY